jgi:hypothetical protein
MFMLGLLLTLASEQIDYGSALGSRSIDSTNRAAADYLSEQAKATRLTNERMQIENARAQAESDRIELPRRVGRMVAQGKCAAAVEAALKGGDLTLAQQTREFCAKP